MNLFVTYVRIKSICYFTFYYQILNTKFEIFIKTQSNKNRV